MLYNNTYYINVIYKIRFVYLYVIEIFARNRVDISKFRSDNSRVASNAEGEFLLTRTRSVSKDNLKDQSSLISS